MRNPNSPPRKNKRDLSLSEPEMISAMKGEDVGKEGMNNFGEAPEEVATNDQDSKIEPVLGDGISPDGEEEKIVEKTRQESRSFLEHIVAPYKAVREKCERSAEYLKNTTAGLNEKMKSLGLNPENFSLKDIGSGVVKVGEAYRKAGLAYKLGLAATLLGTGAFVGFAGAGGAGIIAAGIATQRALSSLGTYALVDALMERRLARKGTYTKTERYVKHGAAIGAGGAMLFGVPGTLLTEGLDAVGAQEKIEWLGHYFNSLEDIPATDALQAPAVAGATPIEVPVVAEAVVEKIATQIDPSIQEVHDKFYATYDALAAAYGTPGSPLPESSITSSLAEETLVDPTRPLEPLATTEAPAVVPLATTVRDFNIETETRELETEETIREATPAPSEPTEAGAPVTEPDAPAVAEASAPVEPDAEVPATPGASAVPEISVEAVAGRGYEDMLWRLADKLPADFVITRDMEGSDVATLFEAKQNGTLLKTVHDLATTHGAFLEGGTSKVIQLSDHISFDDKGVIALNDDTVSSVLEDRGVTPPWPPVSVEVPAPEPVAVLETGPQEPLPFSTMDDHQENQVAQMAPNEPLTPEPAPVFEPGRQAEVPEAPLGVTIDSDQAYTPEVSVDDSSVTAEAPQLFTKFDHSPIDPKTPAIYEAQDPLGGKYLVAYGGTDEERYKFIQEKFLALAENKDKVVRFEHTVKSLLGSEVKIDEIGKPGSFEYVLNFLRGKHPAISPDVFLSKVSK